MAKARLWKKRVKRTRASPAPGFHPPGMSGARPPQAASGLEPREEVERRFLQHVTRLRVRGQASGLPDLMRSDWDRLKLHEAMWFNERDEKSPLDVIKLARARALRAQFNGYARVVTRVEKGLEARPAPSPAQTAVQSSAPPQKQKSPEKEPQTGASAAQERAPQEAAVQESPFMMKLRQRAAELARMSRQREREQDPE